MYEYDSIDHLFPPPTTHHLPRHLEYPQPLPEYSLPSPISVPINGFSSVREAVAALKSDSGSTPPAFCPAAASSSSLPTYLQRPSPLQFQRSLSSQKFPFPRGEFTDPRGCAIRKAFSTGDIQRISYSQHTHRAESPLGHEHCGLLDHGTKVGRYSAEERKERIERYRSKRNQRNFNKKIKYACRKTLADSRPRVRGRFARNDETGDSSGSQWVPTGLEDDEDDEEGWMNFLNSFSMSLIP
ncbi:two-component response regulator-like PRR1 [Aristolochia californica]|uniref:two-component response regulator-like PRR1 n=1 Tax=Aristolochia californica TaxID=171875 RepID=UPI0035E11714